MYRRTQIVIIRIKSEKQKEQKEKYLQITWQLKWNYHLIISEICASHCATDSRLSYISLISSSIWVLSLMRLSIRSCCCKTIFYTFNDGSKVFRTLGAKKEKGLNILSDLEVGTCWRSAWANQRYIMGW